MLVPAITPSDNRFVPERPAQVEVDLNIVAIAPGLRVRFQRVIDHCRQAQQLGKRPRADSLSDWFRNGLPRERKVVLQPNGFARDNPQGTQQPFLCRHIHLFDCEAFSRLLLAVVNLYRPLSTSDCNSQHFVIE